MRLGKIQAMAGFLGLTIGSFNSATKSQTQTVIHSTQPSTTQLLLKINRRFIHTDS